MELRRLIPFGRVLARPGTRRMACCGLLLCLAGLLVRVGALQGWFRPIRVVGGSMAESLYGPHLRVRCQDCGIVFRCGVECPPADNLAVCPNCGYRRNQVDPHAVTRGQRVLIDRWAHAWGGSRVWRAVAFRSPLDPDRLEVKRLVAGNAGQVEIRDGDVYIDGQIQRKSLEQLSAVRVLVHDDRFRPTRDPSLPARWLARREDSGWTTTGSGYSFKPPPGASSRAPDWLDYQQWTCWPNAYPGITRCTLAPILDHYAYNQSLSRAALNRVADVMLCCELQMPGTGRIVLRLAGRNDQFQLELAPAENRCRLLRNDSVVFQTACRLDRRKIFVEFALCDRRVLVGLDGSTLLQYAYEPADGLGNHELRPISIGALAADFQVLAPRVYRDVHYLGPDGGACWKSPRPLAHREWLVLGDNAPLSIDSRRWSALNARAVLGPVVETDW